MLADLSSAVVTYAPGESRFALGCTKLSRACGYSPHRRRLLPPQIPLFLSGQHRTRDNFNFELNICWPLALGVSSSACCVSSPNTFPNSRRTRRESTAGSEGRTDEHTKSKVYSPMVMNHTRGTSRCCEFGSLHLVELSCWLYNVLDENEKTERK